MICGKRCCCGLIRSTRQSNNARPFLRPFFITCPAEFRSYIFLVELKETKMEIETKHKIIFGIALVLVVAALILFN